MSPERKDPVEPESERELTITRVFDAPARLLFLACSKPEHMREWFGPPGFPLTLCEMDFRVGGKYRFAMSDHSGKQMPVFGGEYLAIEPGKVISYTNSFELPGAETMIVTMRFSEQGGKTTLTHHTLFGSIAMKNAHLGRGYEMGVGASLDLLAALGERLAQS